MKPKHWKWTVPLIVVFGLIPLFLYSITCEIYPAPVRDFFEQHGGIILLTLLLMLFYFFFCMGFLITKGVRLIRNPTFCGSGWAPLLLGASGLAALITGMVVLLSRMGSLAHGRPLRVRGRLQRPNLCIGSGWSAGEPPAIDGLDKATRCALEALWLHDAQQEHASVPAFARLSWLLAAVGAPAELSAWCHRAALEEVDHACRCFALAAGYGEISHAPEPMPDLLLENFSSIRDPRLTLALESVYDGCLFESFSADVAEECVMTCSEPTVKEVLENIAREERSHAEFSWALVTWLLKTYPEVIHPALAAALTGLSLMSRPPTVSPQINALVMAANGDDLLKHGRLPDHRWSEIWIISRTRTRDRLSSMVAGGCGASSVSSAQPKRNQTAQLAG